MWPPERPKMPDTLDRYFSQLEARIDAVTPRDGHGSTVTDAAGGGKSVNTRARGGSGVVAAGGPWEILSAGVGDVKVGPNSTLLETAEVDSEMVITNIGNSFTVGLNQVLYLETEYAGSTPTAVTLKGGNKWTEYPVPYKTSGAGTIADPLFITSGFTLLAYGAAPGDVVGLEGVLINVELKVVRCVFTPLRMELTNPGGGFALPMPQAGHVPGLVLP